LHLEERILCRNVENLREFVSVVYTSEGA